MQKIAWLDQKMHTAQSKMANFSNWILLILNTGLARKDINRDREWFFLAIFGVRNRKYYVYYIRKCSVTKANVDSFVYTINDHPFKVHSMIKPIMND